MPKTASKAHGDNYKLKTTSHSYTNIQKIFFSFLFFPKNLCGRPICYVHYYLAHLPYIISFPQRCLQMHMYCIGCC